MHAEILYRGKGNVCGFFFREKCGLVYLVELLKIWRTMTVYMVWSAYVLYLYFQNAFDKVPYQKSLKKFKGPFDMGEDAFQDW